MILANPQAVVGLLFKGGPSPIDLMIDATELRPAIAGPKTLFDKLELVTTMSVARRRRWLRHGRDRCYSKLRYLILPVRRQPLYSMWSIPERWTTSTNEPAAEQRIGQG